MRRAFGPRRAVDGVTLAIAGGDCLALFGPNGAGKTTLLRMLAGLLSPSAGEARVGGQPIARDPEVRARVGLISHHAMLYAALTAQENVAFAARLYGLPDPEGAAREALARMRVLDRADTPVRRLSRGLQQRVSIARAMVHEPRVVLLDEPFTGLDEAGARALTDALTTLKAHGAALVLVTHNLTEGLALGTHVAVMQAGRLVLERPRAAVDDAAFAAEYRALVTAG
ncbi:heme ABC exporter ATP-binding protein CcmA [Roseisolibacter agri]|uniref:heme ABC exporter ATP-binding protein CcmA n=1 Tax=Roseisolibacter agri TaxID=2014610 RepID=UPI0024E11172|nr:heme ABC exporter ATP-binding protein CcmA [Roseisolibacter agri]